MRNNSNSRENKENPRTWQVADFQKTCYDRRNDDLGIFSEKTVTDGFFENQVLTEAFVSRRKNR